jgi:DNA (cytosine-5)-methyltransferase 1
LGLEQAGFDVAAAVEYDPVHAATHEFNFPLTKTLCADVSALEPSTLKKAVEQGIEKHGGDSDKWDGELDLIAGGPPCQGFSLIGRRLVDDQRNKLVFHFYRLIAALKPRYFLMENVPGMGTGGHAGILNRLIQEFEKAGYKFPSKKYEILNAADFGVPQERRRLFLIGTREDQPQLPLLPAATVRPVPKRSSEPALEDSALPAGPTVGDAILDLPSPTRFRSLARTDEVSLSERVLEEIEEGASEYAQIMRGNRRDADDRSRSRIWDPSLLTASMRTDHTHESIRRFRRTKPGETEPVSRFYKLDPNGLCNTLRAGSGSERGAFTSPRPLHPTAPRVLSNREAARLHSFPDWFRPHATKWHGFRQVGNAVAPLMGRAVGREIVEALGVNPAQPKDAIELGDPHLLKITMQDAARYFGADLNSIPAGRKRKADLRRSRQYRGKKTSAMSTAAAA